MTTDTILNAARTYIRRGWAPVPVPRGSKRPELTEWQKLRVRDEQLSTYFTGETNIGIITGEASGGLVDVDLDCDEAVQLADRFLPKTRMLSGREARPRSHLWFRVDGVIPQSLVLKDVDRDKSTLVELRTDRHQTLVSPSIHPNGDQYVWHQDLDPAEVDGKELQSRVHQLAAAILLTRHWPRQPGSRHDIANALAGMLVRADWSGDRVRTFVSTVAQAAGDQEWKDRARAAVATADTLACGRKATGGPTLERLLEPGVLDRVRDWLGIADNSTTPWDPPTPFRESALTDFPVGALPTWLREFVEAEAVATQTPFALSGTLALAACAVGLGGRIRVRVRPGWEEPVNVFTVVVLDPGNRKSAVYSDVTRPIQDLEREEYERLADTIREAETRHRIFKKRLADAEKAAARADPEDRAALEREAVRAAQELAQCIVPIAPRLFSDDVTPEKLAGLLHDHGGRFAVLSAEGGIFDLLAGRYSKDSAPNLDVFLKGHAGDALRVDRMGRPPEHIDQPALTVGLTIQSDVLHGLASKPGFRGRGLLARFLYSIPSSAVGSRETGAPPVPETLRSEYASRMRRILTVEPPTDANGRPVPHVLQLDDIASRQFGEFEAWLEPKLGRYEEYGSIADWASKLAGAVARMAGIIHIADHVEHSTPWLGSIGQDSIARAIELGRYFLEQAGSAFVQMGADPEVEAGNYLLGWIRRHRLTQFTERDAYQGTKGRFKKVADLRPALKLLVDHDYLRERDRPGRSGPGRPPSTTYEVNPQVNSGDIEDSGEGNKKLVLDHQSSPGREMHLECDPQNSQYPQNSPCVTPDACDDSDEVVL